MLGAALVSAFALALALFLGNARGGFEAAAQAPTAPRVAAPVAGNAIGEISGLALSGDRVRVTQGDTLIGETVAKADGSWRLPIPKSAGTETPFHVRIVPGVRRGAGEPEADPVTFMVSVVVGHSRIEVRVQVNSPNGQVDVDVLTPLPA
jgi:hypothetical protein